MKKYLEYIDDKSSKFWMIEVTSESHTVTYGKIGTSGQAKTKNFQNSEQVIIDAEKLVKAKIKKGYSEVTEENQGKWFERLKQRVYYLYKKGIKNYPERPYRYIQINWTDQGYALGMSTDPNDRFWEYVDDDVMDETEWTLEYVYRELENIPSTEFEEEDGCEYAVEFERKEWPFNFEDCRNLEWFLIRVILGITFLKLEKDKDLQKYLSKIEVIDIISVEEYLNFFTYYSPTPAIIQKIVDTLIEKDEDKKLVLDLWSENKDEGIKFLNLFEREISKDVEPVEDNLQVTYNAVLDSFLKLERFASGQEYAKKVIEILEEKCATALQKKEENDDLLEECCHMIGFSYYKLNDNSKAIDWYLKGIEIKSGGKSLLNLMELYVTQTHDFEALVNLGEKHLKGKKNEEFNSQFYKNYYLGIAYVQTGNQKKAEDTYNQLLELVEKNGHDGDKEKVSKSLQELSNANIPNSGVAKNILKLFTHNNLNENEIIDNRKWWNCVPDKVRTLWLRMNQIFDNDLEGVSDIFIKKIMLEENLSLSNNELVDISFVSKMSCLERIHLNYNSITDLSPLEAIPHLRSLSVSNNPIENLTPISNLTDLIELEINECKIKNLSGLESLKKLKELKAKENNLEEIQPISGLSSLRKLNLCKNKIKDISPLENCLNLEYLDLEDNEIETGIDKITQLTFLSDLRIDRGIGTKELKDYPHLTGRWKPYYKKHREELDSELNSWVHLVKTTPFWKKQFWDAAKPDPDLVTQLLLAKTSVHIDNKRIECLDPLSPLKKVIDLSLDGIKAVNLNFIEEWKYLKTLSFFKSNIESLKPLENTTSLEEISIIEGGLTSLKGLENCIEINLLDLTKNKINSLLPLKNLTKIEQLILEDNPLESLEGIENMTELYKINISKSPFIDISPLKNCKELVTINCSDTNIKSGLIDLVNLPKLKKIISNQSINEKDIAEFNKKRPDIYIN